MKTRRLQDLKPRGYPFFQPGDLNAFFGLILDNMTQLVILSSILIGIFGFPRELVLYKIVPGSAMGVLVGDLAYTWMAVRLIKRTGRSDVTAMPLGTGLALGVGVTHPNQILLCLLARGGLTHPHGLV
ncbi:MAG: hypothetical protein ACREIQ_00220 [Nitrospiria bacterium]